MLPRALIYFTIRGTLSVFRYKASSRALSVPPKCNIIYLSGLHTYYVF